MNFLTQLLPLLVAGSAFAAPIHTADSANTIPDSWIVVMKDTMSSSEFTSHVAGHDSSIASSRKSTFEIGSFKGYSGVFTQSVVDSLAASPDVAYIEQDTIVTTLDVEENSIQTQTGAPWGLGRISHREPNSTDYIYDSSAGVGTFAYVIDTGIYIQHNEFEGRASWGANFVGDGLDEDGNGHGTHCAGTIGSRAYGVAKKTNLIAVKVLSSEGSGSNSGVIEGIQWAANDMKTKGRVGKAVANMSLGGVFSNATNSAVAAAVREGLFMAVAAGNDGRPADATSPASEPTACTIGATVKDDSVATYSNFGRFVDIFAPGTAILSTWNGGPDDTNTISGTSMATPHIVGLAAYLTTLEGSRNPNDLCERMVTLATDGVLTGPAVLVTDNKLAYNGNGA